MWPEESERRYEGSGVAGKGATRPEGREAAGGEARKCALGEAMGRKSDCVVAAAISCLCASFTSLLPAVPRKSVSHSSSVLRESQDPWSQPAPLFLLWSIFSHHVIYRTLNTCTSVACARVVRTAVRRL